MFQYNFSKLEDFEQELFCKYVNQFSGSLIEFWKILSIAQQELIPEIGFIMPYSLTMGLKPLSSRSEILVQSFRPAAAVEVVAHKDTHMEVLSTVRTGTEVDISSAIVEEDMLFAPDQDYLNSMVTRIPSVLVDNDGMMLAGMIVTGSAIADDTSYNEVLLTDAPTFIRAISQSGAVSKLLVYDEDLTLSFIQHNCSDRRIVVFIPVEGMCDDIDYKFVSLHKFSCSTIESIDFECTLFAIRSVLQSRSLTRKKHTNREQFDYCNRYIDFPSFSDRVVGSDKLLLSYGVLNGTTCSGVFTLCPEILLFASHQYDFVYTNHVVAIGSKFLCTASCVKSYSTKVGKDVTVTGDIVTLPPHVKRVVLTGCRCGRIEADHTHDLCVVTQINVEITNVLAACNMERSKVDRTTLVEFIKDKLSYSDAPRITAKVEKLIGLIEFSPSGGFVKLKHQSAVGKKKK